MAKEDTDQSARIAQLEETVRQLLAQNQVAPTAQSDTLLLRLSETLERVTGNQSQNAELMAAQARAQQRPSNMVSHNKSDYNPRGETVPGWAKPLLVCPMMIPWRAENENLTREEVELLNLLTQHPGLYVVTRTDESRVKVSVTTEEDENNTRIEKMTFKHDTAFRNEYFRTMPPLARMLRMMLKQTAGAQAAAEVLTMQDELDLIEAGQLTVSA